MSDYLNPVKCGCGGSPEYLNEGESWWIRCMSCGMETDAYETDEEATDAWNRVMKRVSVKEYNDLQPCPFCGSVWIDKIEESEDESFYYCMDCGAVADTKIWNHRAKNDNR